MTKDVKHPPPDDPVAFAATLAVNNLVHLLDDVRTYLKDGDNLAAIGALIMFDDHAEDVRAARSAFRFRCELRDRSSKRSGDAPRRIDRMQRRWRRRELLQNRRQTAGGDRAFDLIGQRAGHADAGFRRRDCRIDAVDDQAWR